VLVVSLLLVRANVLPAWWLLINAGALAVALLFERSG
jgi:hypothetical protein